MEQDLVEPVSTYVAYSQEDMRFLSNLDQSISFKDGHCEMPLPFKEEWSVLPNNKVIAFKRLKGLCRRFDNDIKFRQDYFRLLISNGHAEKVPQSDEKGVHKNVWYIPHHGV